jgi:hypothetical protein
MQTEKTSSWFGSGLFSSKKTQQQVSSVGTNRAIYEKAMGLNDKGSEFYLYFSQTMTEQTHQLWVSTYIPMIEQACEITWCNEQGMPGIATYEQTRSLLSSQFIKEIQTNGIPVPLRGQLWPILIKNKMRINSQLFEIFRNFPFSIQAGIKSTDSQANLIDFDIPRTFPDLNEFFNTIESIGENLREVLTAFKCMRPDVGYCQGMSQIVGMLLLHCGPPQECFKVFCNI